MGGQSSSSGPSPEVTGLVGDKSLLSDEGSFTITKKHWNKLKVELILLRSLVNDLTRCNLNSQQFKVARERGKEVKLLSKD